MVSESILQVESNMMQSGGGSEIPPLPSCLSHLLSGHEGFSFRDPSASQENSPLVTRKQTFEKQKRIFPTLNIVDS